MMDALYSPLPPAQFLIKGGFWEPIVQAHLNKGLLAQWQKIVETDRLENFARVARKESGTYVGVWWFNDSDVYKWIEACAYALLHGDNHELKSAVKTAVQTIASAQDPDGYLFTFVQLQKPDFRWKDLAGLHEMYCAGHLIEAAVAWKENHDEDALLEVAIKVARLIQSTFSPDARPGYCGHPELELALFRLADCTGDQSFAETAAWMVDIRGQHPTPIELEFFPADGSPSIHPKHSNFLKDGQYDGSYAQDHKPIRDHRQIEGHAVRAAYLYTAAARVAHAEQDQTLLDALNAVWENTVNRRMYITGGIGTSHRNEGFTSDYDLPNDSAYAETCAAIALAMWGREMAMVTGESSYLETVERAIFNGILSGGSADATHFFYDNPLESRTNHARVTWFTCPCCPPNLARFVCSVASYAYAFGDSDLVIQFPVAGTMRVLLAGHEVEVDVETDYPHTGKAKFTFKLEAPTQFRVLLRIPDWADEVTTELKGAEEGAEFENGYAVFDRVWKDGEVLSVEMEMQAIWRESNPLVLGNAGRVALSYGPTIYCAETQEASKAPHLFAVATGDEEEILPSKVKKDGTRLFKFPGSRIDLGFSDDAYAPQGTVEQFEDEMEFHPYRDWAANGPSFMQVWIRQE